MSQEDILKKIKEEPNTAKHYLLLAFTLQAPDETVTLLKLNPADPNEQPVVMTQQQLLLKSIELDAAQAMAYMALKNQLKDDLETITLNDGHSLNKMQLIMEALKQAPNEPLPYSALAFVTKGVNTAVLPDGRVMNKNQLYLETVHLEQNLGLMWFRDNYFVKPPDSPDDPLTDVALPDGRHLNREELVNTIIINPLDYFALSGLVLTMKLGSKILIPDQLPDPSAPPSPDPPPGKEKTQEDLALDAVKAAYEEVNNYIAANTGNVDSDNYKKTVIKYAFPFFVMLLTLSPGQTIDTEVTGLGEIGHMGLLREIMRMVPPKTEDTHLTPKTIEYHLFGGIWLKPGDVFTFPDGRQKNQKQMLLNVLELESALLSRVPAPAARTEAAWANMALGYTIGASESITVDGTTMNRQQLFLKAAELDPQLPLAYLCLSLSVTPGDKTPITVNGTDMTDMELYEKYNQLNET